MSWRSRLAWGFVVTVALVGFMLVILAIARAASGLA